MACYGNEKKSQILFRHRIYSRWFTFKFSNEILKEMRKKNYSCELIILKLRLIYRRINQTDRYNSFPPSPSSFSQLPLSSTWAPFKLLQQSFDRWCCSVGPETVSRVSKKEKKNSTQSKSQHSRRDLIARLSLNDPNLLITWLLIDCVEH